MLALYSSVSGAVDLTLANINANLGSLNNPPGAAPDANECFAFKDFINDSENPAAAPDRRAAIHRLRELLNSNNFLDNVQPYLQNTEFLSDRLLELEIVHRNALGNLRVTELRDMVVRINTPMGGVASGILIPIPDIFNLGGAPHHSWGILTGGHILENIPIEKKTLPLPLPAENFEAEFSAPIVGIPNPIPIHSIKVFKTDSLKLQNSNGGGGYENIGDDKINAQDIRGIPRYEYPADLALCYLDLTPAEIQLIDQALLQAPGGVAPYPDILYDDVNHQISFQSIGGFTFNFKFVADVPTRDALVAAVNVAGNRSNNFVLGYPSYNNALTLSKARQNDAGNPDCALYPNFIDPTDVAARPENEFMFFHDAPTYPGMSGGPVFNTPAGNNEINVFGVVQGYNSPDPDDNPLNNKLQSRCGASFLMERILN